MAEKITISAPFSQESRSLGRIGRVGENLSRQIVFDCTSALTDRPNANIVCVIQRTGDKQPYAAHMTRVGDTGSYKLVLTSTEVAKSGSVRFELRMVDGEEILKAAIYTGTVESSMSGIGDTPGEPIPDALNRLETAISEVGKYADLDARLDAIEATGGLSAVGAASGQVPTADGTGEWAWEATIGLDTTLSSAGKAADAKSAGDAIRAVTNTANTLSARANVLSGSVSGASITATDSFAAPFVGLRVFGKSTQDGKPLPTAPVPIVSAGDGGTVVVTVSDGANKSQTLTLQTPNALLGIPVTSGGNYTDENGQQWVCNEVDLTRGVYLQRITKIKLTSSMNWTKTGYNVDRYFCTFDGIDAAGVLCTHFSAAINGETVGGIATNNGTTIGFAYAGKGTTTVDDFKAFLDANEVYIYVPLEIYIKTHLPSAEIAAYKALTTYAPKTVISVSGSAEMIALYQRDANTVAKATGDALNSLQTAVSEVGKYADLKEKVDALQTSGASTAGVADTNAVSIHGADGVYDLSKGTIQARLNDLETGEGLKVEKSTVNTLDFIASITVNLPSFQIEAGKMYMYMPNFEIHSSNKTLSDAFIFIRNWNNNMHGSAPVILLPAIYETSTNYVRGFVCAFNPTSGPISVTGQTVTVEAYKSNGHTFVTNVSGNVINGGTSSTRIANGTGMAQVGPGKELVVDYSATGFTSAPVVVASHCQTGESDTDTSGVVKVLSVTKTGCKISIIGGTVDHDYPVSWIATGT